MTTPTDCTVATPAIVGWFLPAADVVPWSGFILITPIWVATYRMLRRWVSGQAKR